jgi:hypothetical protein
MSTPHTVVRRTHSGPDAGVGAGYAWEGNRIELVMTPQVESATVVEWRVHGELSGFTRVFSLVKSMDPLIGPDFEKGLAKLKLSSENG